MYSVRTTILSTKSSLTLAIIAISFCLVINACNSSSLYEKQHDEMFNAYVDSLGHVPNHADSLYLDMYVALRLSEDDISARDTVIDRAEELLKIDTIASNKRHYLEAMQIVYSMNKDYDNYWKTSLRYFDTYPKESLKRLSSLAMYYKMIGDKDSTDLYVKRTIDVSEKHLQSKDCEIRVDGAMYICMMLIVKGETSRAEQFLDNLIASDDDPEFIKGIKDLIPNFEAFAGQVIQSLMCRVP